MIVAAVAAVALMTAACTSQSGKKTTATPDPSKAASSSASKPAPADQVSAILVQPVHDAQVVRGSDGKDHIEYGLLLVNAFSDPVTLTGVTVVGPDGGQLAKVEGAVLAAATQTLYTHAASPVVSASAAVIVEVDVAMSSGHDVPEHVSNRIDYTLPAGLPGAVIVDDTVVHGPEVEVDRAKASVITAPVPGDGWLATSACCSPNVHRDLRLSAGGLRLATAETFAVDWARVKGDRLYDGDGASNEQFYGFGTNVLAVADGTVVAVADGVQESVPFASAAPKDKEGFGGNQIMLKISDGVYAAYGHLQPGSIMVRVGDAVTAGDVIAKLGNSGPSQGPHLHFGLLDKPDLFVGKSLPFVIKKLTLVGTVDFAASTGDTLAISPRSQQLRNVYPLYGTVANFP